MAGIGDLYYAFRGDGARLQADAKKEGAKAGQTLGKQITGGIKKSFSGGALKQGLLGGLGLGAGLGAVSALSAGVGVLTDEVFKSIDAASDLNEAVSKSQAVFGDSAGEIDAWAGTASEAFGQSKRQALEAAGTFGNLIQAFGIGRTEAAGMSKAMVELASDLASFNNTSVDEALIALRAGLSGESEPLKRYGVALNDVRLKEEALRLGLIKTTKGVLPITIKTQAAYSLILKDTALAQGDFARTSEGLANTQKTLQGQMEDLHAEIGEALLPVMLELAQFMRDDVVPALTDLTKAAKDAEPIFDVLSNAIDVALSGGNASRALLSQQMEDATEKAKVLKERIQRTNKFLMDFRSSEIAESYGTVEEAIEDVGDKAKATGRAVRISSQDMVDASRRLVSAWLADVSALLSGYYDPIIARDELTAGRAEANALRRVIASKTATAAEKRDAAAALTQIEKSNLELSLELFAAGKLNKKETAALFADLRAKLKTSTGTAKVYIQSLINKLRELDGMTVNPRIRITGSKGPHDELAHGGFAPAGVPVWTGELGKELIVPMVDSYVIPHAQSMDIAGRSSGDTINIPLNITGLPMQAETPSDVVRELRRASRLGLAPRRRPKVFSR